MGACLGRELTAPSSPMPADMSGEGAHSPVVPNARTPEEELSYNSSSASPSRRTVVAQGEPLR